MAKNKKSCENCFQKFGKFKQIPRQENQNIIKAQNWNIGKSVILGMFCLTMFYT